MDKQEQERRAKAEKGARAQAHRVAGADLESKATDAQLKARAARYARDLHVLKVKSEVLSDAELAVLGQRAFDHELTLRRLTVRGV